MKSIGDQLRAINKHSAESVEKVVMGTIREMGERIINRSPVDKKAFKANWKSGPSPDSRYNLDDRSPSLSRSILRSATSKNTGSTFYFTNSVPYARKLEYGSSQQAPNGMVRLTALEFESIAGQQVAKIKK